MKKTIYILHEEWETNCSGRESEVRIYDNKQDALKYIRREFDNDWCQQARNKDFVVERTDTTWNSYDELGYEFYRIEMIEHEVEFNETELQLHKATKFKMVK